MIQSTSLPLTSQYPAAVNARYRTVTWLDDTVRQVTMENVAKGYNNAYEFTFNKLDVGQLMRPHTAFFASPWTVTIDGLVEAPMTVSCGTPPRRPTAAS